MDPSWVRKTMDCTCSFSLFASLKGSGDTTSTASCPAMAFVMPVGSKGRATKARHRLFQPERVSSDQHPGWLGYWGLYHPVIYSYIGIIISQYKDPYRTNQ